MMKPVLLYVVLASATAIQEEKAPSLAELAQQTQARRTQRQAVRLITNADLAKYSGARVSIAAPLPAPETAGAEETPPAEEEKDHLSERAAWEERFAEARLNLKNAVNRGLVLQLRMNHLQNAFLQEDDGTTQAFLQAQLQENARQIEENRQEIADARAALEKLQAEARKAGLPPGLIREWSDQVVPAEEILALPGAPNPPAPPDQNP